MSELARTLPETTAVLLRGALSRVEAAGEAALRPLDLNGREYGALALLQHSNGIGNQRSVGAALGLDRTTTMKLMARLVERGLVQRQPDPADRRSYQLAITTAGRRVATRAGRVLGDCDDAATAGRLSDDEVEVLRTLLRRML